MRFARAWSVFVCVGLLAAAAYFLLPTGGVAQAVVYMVLQVAVLVLLSVGTAVYRPARPGVWRLLIVAQVLYLLANVLWYLYPVIADEALSFPGPHDPVFIASYLVEVAALARLVRVRGGSRNRTDLIDATIVALGLATLLWVFQIDRALQGSGISLLGQAFTVAYPLFDLVLFAIVIRLVVAGGRKPVAFWFLAAAVIGQLGSDIGYTETVLRGAFHNGSPIFAGWLLFFVFLGAAALHPSMRELAAPTARDKRTTLRRRLPFLTLASLIGPAVLLIQHARGGRLNLVLIVPVTGVVFLLILARVSDLMVDIAEHERVQGQLSRLALIVESTDDAVVGWAPDGTINSWNRGAEALFGYAPEEILGAPLTRIGPPGRSELTEALVRRVLDGEQVEHFDSECRHKNGGVVEVSITMSTIRDLSGPIIGGAAIGRDISHANQVQAELATARDQALDASRLKSEFLATMSHEIRTPMNGVIGLTGLLLNTTLDDRQRQYAEGVRSAGESLLAVINDILDFSKIEAGKLTLESSDFDLERLVGDVGSLTANGAQAKGLELITWCDPSLPTLVRGDIGRVRQVLTNLVGNAVKFTETGEVLVKATAAPSQAGTLGVRFEVIDTGIGIETEVQNRLFEPFSQADASTTRRYGGTGLGLAISAQLVQAMGGTISLDSRIGAGSTFAFELPFQQAQNLAEPQAKYPAGLLDGVAVLIVDDNATNRLILHEQLLAWSMGPTAVADGPSALDSLRQAAEANQPYSVALLDMCMADMDGLELARRIAADPALAATRTVLLTSAGYVDPHQAHEAGLVEVISKPVRQSRLHDLLMGLTAGSRPAPTPAQNPLLPPADASVSRGLVLVVEDNPTNQMVAVGILAHLGWASQIARDGRAAIDAIARTNFDAVLMDCQMPNMDGYTATAHIRRSEQPGTRLPIIAMTASAIEGDRERCLAAGMDDYIAKPVDPDDVNRALDHWATKCRPQPSAPAAGGSSLDRTRIETLRNIGDPPGDLLARMIDAFIDEFPTSLASLNAAASADDLPTVSRVAHRLRGAAANLGATTLASCCAQLEQTSNTLGASIDHTLLTQLEAEFETFHVALGDACARVSP